MFLFKWAKIACSSPDLLPLVPDHLCLGPCSYLPTNVLAREHPMKTFGGVDLGAAQNPDALHVLEELPPLHTTV